MLFNVHGRSVFRALAQGVIRLGRGGVGDASRTGGALNAVDRLIFGERLDPHFTLLGGTTWVSDLPAPSADADSPTEPPAEQDRQ
jgi:hypothetical protein